MSAVLTRPSSTRWNASWLCSRNEADRQAFLGSLSPEEAAVLQYRWEFWAREKQLPPPGSWRVWLVRAGRGFGKTRVGAEWVRREIESGRRGRIALVGATAADVRDVMIEGERGILETAPPWFRPSYEPSKRRVTWPNGAIATAYSADKPDRLRGPQHDGAWCDELAAWRFLREAWDMLMFGLRLGDDPRAVVTTTPRPLPLIRELIASKTTIEARGSTYENAGNLAPAFLHEIVSKYEGTRLGRQELEAEILDDNPGALWKRDRIEALRVVRHPTLSRIVVGVDPSGGDGEDHAEAGIVAAGLGADGHGYVLDDRTLRATPHGWGSEAVTAYHRLAADRIVAEVNFGGAMVEAVIRTAAKDAGASVAYKAVSASRGKQVRAEPVAALYEQGRVHHVGCFPTLEDEMCEWEPGAPSPNRMDALVWALTELMLARRSFTPVSLVGKERPS